MAPPAALDAALILPGRAYGPDQPLLLLARRLLERWSWAVGALEWDASRLAEAMAVGDVAATAHVESRLVEHVSHQGEPGLLVAKSLGTRAAPYAAGRGRPAVWLTPLLHDPTIVAAIAANQAPQLVVGGTDDPFWDASAAARLGQVGACTVLEVADADHAMALAGDDTPSRDVLDAITGALETFLGGLHGVVR